MEQSNNFIITKNSDGIFVPNHIGTWYVIDTKSENGKDYFLLEHEEFGDEAACLIVDESGKVILDDVHNDVPSVINCIKFNSCNICCDLHYKADAAFNEVSRNIVMLTIQYFTY